MSAKPPITSYEALIRPADNDPDGLHRRGRIESSDLATAKAELEALYGAGMVFSLGGEWEQAQSRGTLTEYRC